MPIEMRVLGMDPCMAASAQGLEVKNYVIRLVFVPVVGMQKTSMIREVY